MIFPVTKNSRLYTGLLILIISLLSYSIAECQDLTLHVWPDSIPGSIANERYKERHLGYLKNVSSPEIQVFLPEKEKATGTAVIICPGGGYHILAIDKEGTQVAKWFAERGIVAVVLKYRLPSDKIMINKAIAPLQDAQEAIRIVRRHAGEWGIDSNKIGIMGFSAGGHLSASLATHYTAQTYRTSPDAPSARPDFTILVYPVISLDTQLTHKGSRERLLGKYPEESMVEYFSAERHITNDTPPSFIVHSTNDNTVPYDNSVIYYETLRKHDVPAELISFDKGKHGYGLSLTRSPMNKWSQACLNWLSSMGF